jgi:hypothetical protein
MPAADNVTTIAGLLQVLMHSSLERFVGYADPTAPR